MELTLYNVIIVSLWRWMVCKLLNK